MGGAITKSRLAEHSERAIKRMETLAAVAQAISTESYLDRILQTIAEMVAETLDSPVCSIMLVDEERQELVISAARCSSEDYLHKMPLKIEDSLIGRVVREGRPIMIPERARREAVPLSGTGAQNGALLAAVGAAVHARHGDRHHQYLYPRGARLFAEDEIDFVKVVAGQAAIAIENARLMSETLEAKRALETRKVVERAKGILQHKLGLTEEDAYLKLRNESRRLRRPMRDLADAVILSDDLERKSGDSPVRAPQRLE